MALPERSRALKRNGGVYYEVSGTSSHPVTSKQGRKLLVCEVRKNAASAAMGTPAACCRMVSLEYVLSKLPSDNVATSGGTCPPTVVIYWMQFFKVHILCILASYSHPCALVVVLRFFRSESLPHHCNCWMLPSTNYSLLPPRRI